MRVLYLCHRIPYPPDKGDKIRAFHQLRAMSARHEVDLFTLADDPADMAHRTALEAYCRSVTVARVHTRWARMRALPFLLSSQPLTLPYFYSGRLAAEVRRALQTRSYDRIFVYCSAMAQYVDAIGNATQAVPTIVDLVDVDSDKWIQYSTFASFPLSAVYRREGRALRNYERRVCQRASCVLVSTEREARLVREISSTANAHVVPNGVDADYFSPLAVAPQAGPPAVIFTGDMSYFPNAEAVAYFANRVLPAIRRAVPDTRFLIVGRNPGPRVRALHALDGVEVTGFVPDVRTYLARARVAVAPFSIAAGIQNKILEAMAYGLPVVATSRTAQGLSASVAALVEKGDTPEEIAAATVRLLLDVRTASRIGLEGRSRVTEEYRWEKANDLCLDLLERPVPVSHRAKNESVGSRIA